MTYTRFSSGPGRPGMSRSLLNFAKLASFAFQKILGFECKSLRRVVAELKSLPEDSLEMAPLRKGR